MARPFKARRVCSQPTIDVFGPLNQESETRVELTQEECATQMGVARTTVQAVYNSARKKLADCLVNGRQLQIRGGNYRLCPESGNCCGKDCGKRRCQKRRCNNRPGGEFDEDCSNIR